MAQIGNIPEIIEVKKHLDSMKQTGLIKEWELPYENLLTRRSAAIFFLTPVSPDSREAIWQQLNRYENFTQNENAEKLLSQLDYQIEFKSEND